MGSKMAGLRPMLADAVGGAMLACFKRVERVVLGWLPGLCCPIRWQAG